MALAWSGVKSIWKYYFDDLLFNFEPALADLEVREAFGAQKAGSIVLKNYYYICSCKIDWFGKIKDISQHLYNRDWIRPYLVNNN